ncbi:MAG: threonylcarbamoyl-AMP synthase [Bacteroidetes bacterium]|nr:threonylcarbamoyl-AMP synthase [Bacteroidota bacterium]
MQTIIGKDLNEAKILLQRNEVVGIPTETVYGLAANALNSEAVLKIFTVKERPHFDPLIVHTHAIGEIEKYVSEFPAKARMLLEAFSPGPLTVLLKKKAVIPDLVTSGLDTVAMRIPKQELSLQLLRQLDFPLAAPSANPFGYISPTSAAHVYHQLNGKIPYILDGGSCQVGVESTIVGFENNQVIVYRLGGLSLEDLERVAGTVIVNSISSSNPVSPGLLKSHYAPRTPFRLVTASEAASLNLQKNSAVIGFNEWLPVVPKDQQFLLSEKGNLNEAAKNLFAVMRQLDQMQLDEIVAVEFPEIGLGKAINDRLQRAAAKH